MINGIYTDGNKNQSLGARLEIDMIILLLHAHPI